MKKKILSAVLLGLCLLSVVWVGGILVQDLMRSPTDWMNKASLQMKNEDYRGALLSLTRAAKGGEAKAAYKLALLYDAGTKIPENRSKAIALMTRAAKKQLPEAFYVLGVWAERGYMGNVNPKKIIALKGYGLEVVDRVTLDVDINKYNKRYIETKKTKMHHLYSS